MQTLYRSEIILYRGPISSLALETIIAYVYSIYIRVIRKLPDQVNSIQLNATAQTADTSNAFDTLESVLVLSKWD